MKHQRTIVIVLLNVLFCAIVLYFFANYSQLRPYAGSAVKEVLAGLVLLATLYANYFLLYPLLHKKLPVVYWVVVVFVSIVAGLIEMVIAHRFGSVSVHLVVQRQRGVPEKDAMDEGTDFFHSGSHKRRASRRMDYRIPS